MEKVKNRHFNKLSAVVKPLPIGFQGGHQTKHNGEQIDLFWVRERSF